MLRLTLLAASAATAAGISFLNFDLGWKYVLGDSTYGPGSCDASGFTQNISGTQCFGLASVSGPTPEACQATCCLDNTCTIWQYDPSNQDGGPCWVGSDCSDNTTNAAWTSFARATPSPAPSQRPDCTDAGQPCNSAFNDGNWRSVNLPHDFIVEGAPNENADRGHGYLPFNVSWYRRHFTVDASLKGKLISVYFDGVYKNSDVWLNNVYLGHFTSGYVSFRYWLHNASSQTAPGVPVLNYGATENVLAVRVDALSSQEGWFYEGGGINRHTKLEILDPLSVAPWGAYFPSAITGPITSGPDGVNGPQTAASSIIYTNVDVANARAVATNFTLNITVIDPATGASVGQSVTSQGLGQGGWARIRGSITTGQVNLWNLVSTSMYNVTTEILIAGEGVVDSVTTRIGIRDAIWTANTGFMLNGFKVLAQGVSNHQDFGGAGVAVPDRVNVFRVATMKAIGVNFWRTAHNPVNSELLDFCDEQGMLVWEENRFIQKGVQPLLSAKATPAPLPPDVAVADPQLLADAQAMVLRDRNHPSIVIWSLCNEGGCSINRAYGGVIGAQFKDAIIAADTTRPITGNSEWDISNTDTLTNVMDVVTCSYNYDLYSLYHYTHPNRPIMGGESASCTSDRGYYLPSNATTGHVYSDDDGCVVNAWQSAANDPWASGNFAWTGHDYKGEPTPFNWPDINSHFGIIDMAGYEKDAAGYYRAWWLPNGGTYLKLVPGDWNAPVPVGTPITLRAYTGAASVEAFVNGVSLGKLTVEPLSIKGWNAVPFAPGNISAIAYDANGNVVATTIVKTTGPASTICVTEVNIGSPTYAADGQDVAMFEVSIVDAEGNVVPNAGNTLTFSVTGPGHVFGLANGDPADHTPDKVGMPDLPYGGVWARPAWKGYARALVQTQAGTPGVITLNVTSPGLTAGQAAFTSQ